MANTPPALSSSLQDRYQNMVASFGIEGIELDADTRRTLDQVLSGNMSVEELERQILSDYAGGA